MEGFLKIKTGMFFGKDYYFVLTNDCLVFCEKRGQPVEGRFHLKISTVENNEKKPSIIILNNGFNKIELEAENVGVKIKWMNAILARQEELNRYEERSLNEILHRDEEIPNEVKEMLENKYSNLLADLWNHQSIIDENLDSLARAIKDSFLMTFLTKIQREVASIKKMMTSFDQFINEEKTRIYKLYKYLQNSKEISLKNTTTPIKPKKFNPNSSYYNAREASMYYDEQKYLLNSDARRSLTINNDIRRSFMGKEEYHQANNSPYMEKYLRNQEKIDESALENKDYSVYNDFSEDKIEMQLLNPLQMMREGNYSQHQSEETNNLEILKEKSIKKFLYLTQTPLFNNFSCFETRKRKNLPYFKQQSANFNLGSIFQISQKNLAIYAYEPLTELQKLCEKFENVSYLLDACKQMEPCMKMGYIIAFILSGISPKKTRLKFPFPSILGETYELVFEQNQRRMRFIAEKISTSPKNTITFHCSSDLFEIYGTINTETSYWGKSIEIQPIGLTYFRIFGEHTYVISNAYTIKIMNLENETPQTLIEGSISFRNLITKDEGQVTFIKEFMAYTNNNFTGLIKNSKREKKFSLFGIWDSNFMLENTQTKKVLNLWENSNNNQNLFEEMGQNSLCFSDFVLSLNAFDVSLIEKLPSSDARFRNDVRALELGEVKLANEEKTRIETKNYQSKYSGPKYFKEKKESYDIVKEYLFNGEYWKFKDEGKFDDFEENLLF